MKAIQGNILVVDDYALNRIQLKRHLEDQGHTVALAENGLQAVEMLETVNFDLVLLDILMPEMDGFEVLARLKGNPAYRDLPVIVISALDEMANVTRCIAMGAEDFLPKPFDPLLLRARLGACLEKKRLRDQEVEYLVQVQRVTGAASAVEAGAFDAASLDEVAGRTDALGQLARVFQRMAREVAAREQALREQLHVLHIQVDQLEKARQVAEITESEYFNALRTRSQRRRAARGTSAADHSAISET